MDFAELVKCVSPFLPKGASRSKEKATQAIIDNFTDENLEFSDATLKNYATKGLSKQTAKKLWSKRNEDKFRKYINSIPENQRELLATDIAEYANEEVDENNVSYVCERLLLEIVKAAIDPSSKESHEGNSKSDDYAMDGPMIVEVSGHCPLCGKDLIKKLRTGKKRKNYKIVKIFPENLDIDSVEKFEQIKKAPINIDAEENLIALCSECAEDYEVDPNIEVFEKLVNDKNSILQDYNVSQKIRSISLNQQLGELMIRVASLSSEDLSGLSYGVVKIEDKITKNFMLQNEIQKNVSLYYLYIEETFSNMDNSSELDYQYLAQQVAYCYRKLKESGMNQNKIFNRISEWFIENVNLSDDYKLASQVLTSFFVQNCEVFENANAK